MKFGVKDIEAIQEADRKANLKAARTWRLDLPALETLIEKHYRKPYYETYMVELAMAIQGAVIDRIAKQIMDAPLSGMMDSYPVMRRKVVLDILHERYDEIYGEDADT